MSTMVLLSIVIFLQLIALVWLWQIFLYVSGDRPKDGPH